MRLLRAYFATALQHRLERLAEVQRALEVFPAGELRYLGSSQTRRAKRPYDPLKILTLSP